MIPALLLLAAVTIGDPVILDLPKGPVVLEKPVGYEVVSNRGRRVVVRTFQPKPFTVAGTAGGEGFRRTIEVRSVLKANDDLKPAPLAPPRAEAEPRLPWILIAIAGVLAIAAWSLLALRVRRARAPRVTAVPLTPAERYRQTVEALRTTPDTPLRWARLADALRDYLAATSELSHDLTTTEVLQRTADNRVADVLHRGDREKFSPWGAPPDDFEQVAARALEVAA
jgi:hypothetical protein